MPVLGQVASDLPIPGQPHVHVTAYDEPPDTVVGTWVRGATSTLMAYQQSDGVVASSAAWTLPVAPGTYDIRFAYSMGLNRGIATIEADNGDGIYAVLGTVDTYNGSTVDGVTTLPGVTVPGSALRRSIRVRAATKNASSSAYYLVIQSITFDMSSGFSTTRPLPWTKVIDLPMTTLTGWTVQSGTWGLTGAGSTIRQTNTVAGEQMLILNTAADLTDCFVEVEIMINTSISTANGRAGLLLDEPFTGSHTSGGMFVVLLTGTTLTVVDKVYWEQQAVLAGPTSPVMSTTFATGTWVTFRVHRVGTLSSAYVNGVFIGQAHVYPNAATKALGKLGLYTYTSDSSFRNLKVWTKNQAALI